MPIFIFYLLHVDEFVHVTTNTLFPLPQRPYRRTHEHQRRFVQHIIFEMVTLMTTQILTGHEHGVLSVSWCYQDADLSLSCRKDDRPLLELSNTRNHWHWQGRFIHTKINWHRFSYRCSSQQRKTGHSGFLGVHGIQGCSWLNTLVVWLASTYSSWQTTLEFRAQVPTRKPGGEDVFYVLGFLI